MVWWHLFTFLGWAVLLSAGDSPAQVVVNEIMSNVRGSESGSGSPGDRMEFIELFNTSPAEAVDLEGWSVADDDAIDRITAWDGVAGDSADLSEVVFGTTRLEAGQFALIIDPEYFQGGDGGWYAVGDGALVLVVENTTLGDGLSTGDPVLLIEDEGDTISTFGTPGWDDGFPDDPGDGVSWERFDPAIGDQEGNWMTSRDPSGSTPGRRNSLSIPINLTMVDSALVVDPVEPGEGETVKLSGVVRNRGLLPVQGLEVHFFLDQDGDGQVDGGEIQEIDRLDDPLLPGQSIQMSGEIRVEGSGYVTVGMAAIHAEEGDQSDNTATREIRVGGAAPRIIVNEIYYHPEEGEVEWIEIYNRSGHPVDLRGWTLTDGKVTGEIPEVPTPLSPGVYAVLTGDSAILVERFPSSLEGRVVGVDPFPTLDDRGDTVSLSSADGYLSERIAYTSHWGGREGVSLERVNTMDILSGAANWGSSVDARGSTPGVRNSIYQGEAGGETSLWTVPEVFSPDGDGREDRTVIGYSLPVSRARVRIEVYDVTGRRVKVALDQAESGGQGLIVWDGRDEGGRVLPVGIYIVYLEAIESFSGFHSREKVAVVLGAEL